LAHESELLWKARQNHGGDTHDQKRVTTPASAVTAGADYLVIGRAITEADNPEAVVDEIVKSIS